MIALPLLLLVQSTGFQPLPAAPRTGAGPSAPPAAAAAAPRAGRGAQALTPPTTGAVPAGPQAAASASPFPDCNRNGVPDPLEIAAGTLQDCQGDGVPDDCQLEVPYRYVYGDGIINGSVGSTVRHYAWLTRHVVQPGQEVVTDIELAWGLMASGTPATLCLWLDPDGDGDPTDAQPILSHVAQAQFPQTAIVVSEDVPDTYIGPAGTSFFVGAYGEFEPAPANYPGGLDADSTAQQSWWITSTTPIDPAALASGGVQEFGLIGTFIAPNDGDWGFRVVCCSGGHCQESADVDMNGVPDECEDCNGNSVPDSIDVATGTSTDCDGNLVPDDCEALADCDGNGLPDLCQAQNPQGIVGRYYLNKTLQGEPLVRIDPDVFFDFGATPPFPGQISGGNFSVRWTGAIRTGQAAGSYTFGVEHNRGVRLWVNGVLLIDDWWDGGGFDTGSIDLAANTDYFLTLEYFSEGNGRCELSWQEPGGAMTPVLTTDLAPNQDSNQDGVPDSCQFTDCDRNGVEDAVDLALGTATDCDADGTLDACQPCDDADGNGLLDACEAAAGQGLVGQYYTTRGGNPPVIERRVLVRVDPNIDFDWGSGGPQGLSATDQFLVRWTGSLVAGATGGDHALHVQSDDGVRLWLDDVLLVDEWHPSSGDEYTVVVPLAAGSRHSLRVDYYESGGGARVFLRWTEPGGVKVLVPQSALLVSSDADGDGVPDLGVGDCDGDGVPDPLEADLNGNCVPDECEGGSGYWRFEEPGGGLVQDATGGGNVGSLRGLPARTTEVPVDPVPLTGQSNGQALDLGWQGVTSGGFALIPDAVGALGAGDADFTLEAWVRLDELATPDIVGAYEADERQWLFMKKPAASSDSLLDYALLVQGADLGGFAGNQLLFRYGDGGAVRSVTSTLRIVDTDWHFVSLAFDAYLQEVRFGLDGIFDTVQLGDVRPDLALGGDLLLGAHENQSGAKNQFLRGTIDEARFTPALLPPDALLDREP